MAFDGTSIWVVNQGSNDVTKLRVNDGANLGTFGRGNGQGKIAFDGVNMWVTNYNDGTVSKL
jgi:DNA-binding beta-propeller fold protein YncE